MTDRIHRVLDGELDPAELTPEERRELAQYRALLEGASSAMGRYAAPDLSARVMAEIGAADADAAPRGAARLAGPVRRAWQWLWQPRTVRLRPVQALAFAALVALMLPMVDGSDAPPTPPGLAVEEQVPHVYVHFRLDAPDASSVRLAGDFTGWEPTYELNEVAEGVWAAVVPVKAGVHDYAFVVDGEEWTPDPLAMQVDDGFGGTNSRLSVLPPEQGRV